MIRFLCALLATTVLLRGGEVAAFVQAAETLDGRDDSVKQLSLEELMSMRVSTVSRKTEQWWTAAGAIDIVTGEEIRRSGVLSLQDSLRLAAGIHVTQPAGRVWGIGMRGFNVPGGNKINVQIDGRTLFTPFYSGVFWDAQDVMLADVDRIEVARGPLGALWGAYAVNGFIQILSKPAWQTQGALLSGAVSTENEHVVNLRYGGKLGQDTFYRVYAQYRGLTPVYRQGDPVDASTDFFQSGFRVDWRGENYTVMTWQGDVYTNKGLARDGARDEVSGVNLLGKWQRQLSFDSDVQLVTYYDHTNRDFIVGLSEERDTVQLNGKYHVNWGRHEAQIGTDNSVSWDRIGGIPVLQFDPARRTVYHLSFYANHVYTWVSDRFSTTVGAKTEENTFSGFEIQPTVRAAWTPSTRTTVWAALSRAIRTPVRLDHDIVFPGLFYANDQFKAENVTSHELGIRTRPNDRFAIDLALFANRYNNLRSYQPIGDAPLPLTFRNMLNARAEGVEVTVLYQPTPRLFVKGAYRFFDIKFSEDPGARNPFGTRFEANDPRHMGTLMLRMDLNASWEFDVTGRYVGELPWRDSEDYLTADVRLGWSFSRNWTMSIIGRNLLDRYHVESVMPQSPGGFGAEVARSLAVRSTWKF